MSDYDPTTFTDAGGRWFLDGVEVTLEQVRRWRDEPQGLTLLYELRRALGWEIVASDLTPKVLWERTLENLRLIDIGSEPTSPYRGGRKTGERRVFIVTEGGEWPEDALDAAGRAMFDEATAEMRRLGGNLPGDDYDWHRAAYRTYSRGVLDALAFRESTEGDE